MLASDPNGDTLEYRVECSPSLGTITIDNANMGTFTFTPFSNTNGPDSFAFQASDGQLESKIIPIYIDISPVNDPPKALDLIFEVWETETIQGNFSAFDEDNEDEVVQYLLVEEPFDGDALTITQSANQNASVSVIRRGINPFYYTLSAASPLLLSGKDT